MSCNKVFIALFNIVLILAMVASVDCAQVKKMNEAIDVAEKQTVQQACDAGWFGCIYYRGTVGDCDQHRALCRYCLQTCTGVNDGRYHHCLNTHNAVCV